MTGRMTAALGAAIAVLGVSGTVFATGLGSHLAGPVGRHVPASAYGTAGGMVGSTGSSGGMMGGSGSYGGMMGGAGSGGMMGGGMMGGRMMGTANAGLVDGGALRAFVRRGDSGAVIDKAADTVRYSGASVTLVALASPHGKPNMTWEIDGLVNPTISVPAGARITVELVNADWGYMHGFELTTMPPPYPYMSMMGIAKDYLVMPLPERTTKSLTTAQFYTRDASFTLAGGTYYYMCPVPGHAQQGMYGRLTVEPHAVA